MAGNRMLLVFRPTGKAIILAKQIGGDWVGGSKDLPERMLALMGAVEEARHENPTINQDDFYLAMESGENLPGVLVEGWDYTKEDTGVDGLLQLLISDTVPFAQPKE